MRRNDEPVTTSKILIVEDERPIREMIAFHLSRAGYETLEAADCREARELLVDERPALALIDWMLPDMSGLELTRMLKRDTDFEDLAVIMLTARADEHDKVSGLEGGADDYVTKPFSPRELVARIGAVLRRVSTPTSRPTGDVLTFDGLVIDVDTREVRCDGRTVELSALEFDLLTALARSPRRVFTRAQLMEDVWGWD